jgi:hypothetical protein
MTALPCTSEAITWPRSLAVFQPQGIPRVQSDVCRCDLGDHPARALAGGPRHGRSRRRHSNRVVRPALVPTDQGSQARRSDPAELEGPLASVGSGVRARFRGQDCDREVRGGCSASLGAALGADRPDRASRTCCWGRLASHRSGREWSVPRAGRRPSRGLGLVSSTSSCATATRGMNALWSWTRRFSQHKTSAPGCFDVGTVLP